jgi:hypothetical protein
MKRYGENEVRTNLVINNSEADHTLCKNKIRLL